MTPKPPTHIPVTAEHLSLLDRDGAAALARRDAAWLSGHTLGIAEAALVSCASLAALWLWDSPPLAMLVVLVASLWFGILGDCLKAVLLRAADSRAAAVADTDQAVWGVARAVMAGDDRLLVASQTPQSPGTIRWAELIMGAAGTAVLAVVLVATGHDLATLLAEDARLQLMLAALLLMQASALAWMVLRQAGRPDSRVATGPALPFRGLALYLLVFAVLAAGDEGRDLRRALSVVNAIMLLVVAPAWLLALRQMRREARWLEARLAGAPHPGRDT